MTHGWCTAQLPALLVPVASESWPRFRECALRYGHHFILNGFFFPLLIAGRKQGEGDKPGTVGG